MDCGGYCFWLPELAGTGIIQEKLVAIFWLIDEDQRMVERNKWETPDRETLNQKIRDAVNKPVKDLFDRVNDVMLDPDWAKPDPEDEEYGDD